MLLISQPQDGSYTNTRTGIRERRSVLWDARQLMANVTAETTSAVADSASEINPAPQFRATAALDPSISLGLGSEQLLCLGTLEFRGAAAWSMGTLG